MNWTPYFLSVLFDFICLSFNFHVFASDEPYGYVRRTDKVIRGQSVTFVCSFNSITSNPFDNKDVRRQVFSNPITWYIYDRINRREREVTDGQLMHHFTGTQQSVLYRVFSPMSLNPISVLLISNCPFHLNNTLFVCKNAGFVGDVQTFQLLVHEPTLYHTGKPKLSVLKVARGTNVTLQCLNSYDYLSPLPSVYWTRQRNDDSENTFGMTAIIHWGNTYVIPVIDSFHSVYTYNCFANNFITPKLSYSFNVVIYNRSNTGPPSSVTALYNGVQPTFSDVSVRAVPVYGRVFTLTCKVISPADVLIDWSVGMKNQDYLGAKLSKFPSTSYFIYNSKSGQNEYYTDLIFKKFDKTDRNNYTCLFRNQFGQSFYTFNLDRIRGLPSSLTDAPTATTIPTAPSTSVYDRIDSGSGMGSTNQLGSGAGGRVDDEDFSKPHYTNFGSGNVPPTSNILSEKKRLST